MDYLKKNKKYLHLPDQGRAGANPSWYWAMVGNTLEKYPVHHSADI